MVEEEACKCQANLNINLNNYKFLIDISRQYHAKFYCILHTESKLIVFIMQKSMFFLLETKCSKGLEGVFLRKVKHA